MLLDTDLPATGAGHDERVRALLQHVGLVHTYARHRTASAERAEDLTAVVLDVVAALPGELPTDLAGELLRPACHLAAEAGDRAPEPEGLPHPLADLDPTALDVVLLRFALGRSAEEVAAVLGLSGREVRVGQLDALRRLTTGAAGQGERRRRADRRRADDFETLLAVPRQHGRRAAVPDEDLMPVVRLLRALPPVPPAPAYQAVLEDWLAEARRRPAPGAVAPAPRPVRPDSRGLLAAAAEHATRGRLAAAGAGVLLAGVVVAAGHSAPGDLLHPLKRGTESVRLLTSDAGTERGDTLLALAEHRLDETESLSRAGDGDAARAAADALVDLAGRAVLAYAEDPQRDDDRAMQAVRDFAAQALPRLERLGRSVPTDAAASVIAATDYVAELDRTAVTACPGCTGR